MTAFKIKSSSLLIYELTFLIITFGGTFLGFYLGKTAGNDAYIFILLLVGLTLAVFIPDLLSTVTCEWVFTESEIHIKWLSQFIFNRKQDINIKWQDVLEYKYEPSRYFDLFRIRLHDQTTMRFWHSNFKIMNPDDFDAFITYFEKQIAAYNEKDLNILHPIRRRKTFYETRLGTVMAILTALGLLAIPILFDAFPATKIDLYPLVFGYTGGIYFISKVIVYRIKKSRHQLPI